MAYWHKPRFTSSNPYTDFVSYTPFWQALYDADAELVLNGHDHSYQRYGPLDANGTSDPARGVREFVIGTGGRSNFYTPAPDSRREVAISGTSGVVEFTLRQASYSWRFVAEAGSTQTDSGSVDCH